MNQKDRKPILGREIENRKASMQKFRGTPSMTTPFLYEIYGMLWLSLSLDIITIDEQARLEEEITQYWENL